MTIEAMFRPPDFYNLAPGHGPGQQQQPLHEPSKVEHLDPLVNQLCRVCDEPAAGFHFGAFTCEGCKSFFGRTCNNQSVIAECKNSYRCVVDKKNRTSCKACRLRKCLMVGMSKSGSRYGRRSNWFKIHCLMQANSNKRPLSSPASAPLPPPPPPPASVSSSLQESQLPPTLRWPLSPSLTRLSLPQLPASAPPPLPAPAPHKSLAVSASAFESYANLLKQAGEAKMTEAMKKCSSEAEEDGDMISVSRSPSPPPRHEASPDPSPLNVSSISDTSSKSSHSLGLLSAAAEAAAEAKHASLLDINKNTGHVSAPPPATPPIFPFGLSPPQLPSLPHLYNPLTFASPLYRLSPLLAANSLFGNPLLMFGGHKTHLDILEEHRKLIEKFGIASAAMSKSSEESFEEKAVKVEDPIDLTFKTSDDDRCEEADPCDPV